MESQQLSIEVSVNFRPQKQPEWLVTVWVSDGGRRELLEAGEGLGPLDLATIWNEVETCLLWAGEAWDEVTSYTGT